MNIIKTTIIFYLFILIFITVGSRGDEKKSEGKVVYNKELKNLEKSKEASAIAVAFKIKDKKNDKDNENIFIASQKKGINLYKLNDGKLLFLKNYLTEGLIKEKSENKETKIEALTITDNFLYILNSPKEIEHKYILRNSLGDSSSLEQFIKLKGFKDQKLEGLTFDSSNDHLVRNFFIASRYDFTIYRILAQQSTTEIVLDTIIPPNVVDIGCLRNTFIKILRNNEFTIDEKAEVGLSSIEYNQQNSKYLLITSYEKDENYAGIQWSIDKSKFEPFDCKEIINNIEVELIFIGSKPEGIDIASEDKKIIVFDNEKNESKYYLRRY